MTMLPPASPKKLGLVIDLDTCVGCHACAVACKEWNDGGQFGSLPDENPYGREPLGVPFPIWIAAAAFLVFRFTLSQTRFGAYVAAIGGNQEALRLAGVHANVYHVAVYALVLISEAAWRLTR